MEFTTHLGLHSQATRLLGESLSPPPSVATGLAPSTGKRPRSRRTWTGVSTTRKRNLPNTTSPAFETIAGFSAGLIPVRSPLLRKSLHDIRQRNDDSTTPLTKRRRSRRGALRTSSPPTFGCCVCRVSNIYFQNKSIAHHTTLWLMFFNSRPSDRSGPGYFSTDRNVRSKCRCSNVSCSSHYDAQLTAFFIDPRAK
ncbi:unnamed protein product [Parnassius mnemosyne]|uniref:Uncharacterized protein n=1 Tax=Parnassius mnemosyne TaxID=213953 RepID=A0AAV1LYG2_9NEOP